MYIAEGGYNTNPEDYKTKISTMVDWCEQNGIYCLIDFHGLNPGNPIDATYQCSSDFWDYFSKKYSSKKHVLYEIFNEPNGCT